MKRWHEYHLPGDTGMPNPGRLEYLPEGEASDGSEDEERAVHVPARRGTRRRLLALARRRRIRIAVGILRMLNDIIAIGAVLFAVVGLIWLTLLLSR